MEDCIQEYQKQQGKGVIQKAYRGLMDYIMGLRTRFMKTYPDYSVSGSIYYGYMDMTYFAVSPEPLKERKLKIAIVFLHEAFQFEVWLSAANKQIQAAYWQLINDNSWTPYRLVPQGKGVYSIIDHVLVDNPDFRDLDARTQQIETGTLSFIEDVQAFLTSH